MNSKPLTMVAPPKSSDRRVLPKTIVWHLGLDQITSGTGEIVNRILAPAEDAGSSTFIFDERNVLYSKLRPYLNKVICPDSIGVATTELVPLRPDPKQLDRHYLCYYLRSPSFVSWISSKVAGAKMPRADWTFIGNVRLPLPPTSEQASILAVIARETKDLDDTIQRANDEIKLIREHRDRLIFDVVTGQVDVRGWVPSTDDVVADEDLAVLGGDEELDSEGEVDDGDN